MYINVLSGTYSLSNPGEPCPSGKTAVDDLNDCLMAVTYFQGQSDSASYTFITSLYLYSWPGGCFLYIPSTFYVYFNTNSNGNANPYARQICE